MKNVKFALIATVVSASALFSSTSQAQIKFNVDKGPPSGELTLSAKVNYGMILSPIYSYKLNLQQKINEAFECNTPGHLGCDEYPIGQLIGDKKFLMIEEPKDTWNHPVVEYVDKDKARKLMLPIEFSPRPFPDLTGFPDRQIKNFNLLNPDVPGAAIRAFSPERKSLGDTLVKLVPHRNLLYTHTCQILPGASLVNNTFEGTYTWFKAKVFGKTIKSSVDFSGHLGGASFDALKICALMKTEVKNNVAVNTVIDVLPPLTYNLKRIPLEIKISSASWIQLLVLAVIIAALLILIPGAIFKILAVIALVIAAVIGIGGMLSSKIATKYANQQVDKSFQQYTGLKIDDFNKEGWERKLKYENLPIFKTATMAEGEFKDGSWAAQFLGKNLLRDHQLLAQITVELGLDKYFEQYALPTGEKLKPLCEDLAKRVLERASGLNLSSVDANVVSTVSRRIGQLCAQVNVRTNVELFIPLDFSKKNGCYDGFVRLEEIQSQKSEVLHYLADKLKYSAGTKYKPVVEDAIQKKLADFTGVQASNWWARQDSTTATTAAATSAQNYCGFDNRITVNFTLPEETRFVACLLKDFKAAGREVDDLNFLKNLATQIVNDCRVEIRELGLGKK